MVIERLLEIQEEIGRFDFEPHKAFINQLLKENLSPDEVALMIRCHENFESLSDSEIDLYLKLLDRLRLGDRLDEWNKQRFLALVNANPEKPREQVYWEAVLEGELPLDWWLVQEELSFQDKYECSQYWRRLKAALSFPLWEAQRSSRGSQ